jgi:protein-tyrosine phosphatase
MDTFHRIRATYGSVRGGLRHLVYSRLLLGVWTRPAIRPFGRVVFVCDGNICRSALAHAVARHHGLTAVSYGLAAKGGLQADRTMKLVAAELGYDLSRHITSSWSEYRPRPDDLILVMEPRHLREVNARLYKKERPATALLGLLATPSYAYIHDPFGLSEDYFRRCAGVVENAVKALAATGSGAEKSPRG